jgi:hypothetical protein
MTTGQTSDRDAEITQELMASAARSKILERLRRATHYMPDGKKATSPSIIGQTLSDTQLIEVWARLSAAKKRGVSIYDQLAYRMKTQWGLFPNLSEWHVSRAIMHYEQRIFGAIGVVETVPELAEWAKTQLETAKQIVEKVDGLDTLSNAIRVQVNRIEGAVEREKSLGMLMPYLFKEFRVLRELTKTYMEYQLEFGLVQRQPLKFQVGIGAGFEEQKQLIDRTVGQKNMLNAASKMLDMFRSNNSDFECITLDECEVEAIPEEG